MATKDNEKKKIIGKIAVHVRHGDDRDSRQSEEHGIPLVSKTGKMLQKRKENPTMRIPELQLV